MTGPADHDDPALHELTGAYVLDALDPAERAAFEAHLTVCPTCPAEVAQLRETASQLSALVAVEPPAPLRASVLASIARISPLPALPPLEVASSDGYLDTQPGLRPLTGDGPRAVPPPGPAPVVQSATPTEAGRPDRAPEATTGRTGRTGRAVTDATTDEVAPVTDINRAPRRRAHAAPRQPRRDTAARWRVLSAAAAVVAVACLAWAVVAQRSVGSERDQAEAAVSSVRSQTADAVQLQRLLDAQDLRVSTATDESSGVTSTVLRSATLDRTVAVFSGLPSLSAGQQFETWNQAPSSTFSSGGVFDARDGRAIYAVKGQTADAKALALSVEDTGGSSTGQPTTTPISVVSFSS